MAERHQIFRPGHGAPYKLNVDPSQVSSGGDLVDHKDAPFGKGAEVEAGPTPYGPSDIISAAAALSGGGVGGAAAQTVWVGSSERDSGNYATSNVPYTPLASGDFIEFNFVSPSNDDVTIDMLFSLTSALGGTLEIKRTYKAISLDDVVDSALSNEETFSPDGIVRDLRLNKLSIPVSGLEEGDIVMVKLERLDDNTKIRVIDIRIS